jgi:hypothetical protein
VADPVIFDRSSAERIASAVRRVEIGDRSESPLRFDTVPPTQQRKTFRIATFSGAWAINATKTVTFKYQTATPNTASVVNLFFPMPAPAGTTDCAIAKDGTAWHLIDVPFETATAIFISQTATGVRVVSTANQTAVSNVLIAAELNTSNCAITVSRTQATVSLIVLQSTATAVFVSSTYTASFVRFKVT